MMFATCEVKGAIRFLKKAYPEKEIKEEQIPKLVDLIGKDILRIQDPDFHIPAQIVSGRKYDKNEHLELVNEAINEFMDNVHNA